MASVNYTYKNPTTGATASATDSVSLELYDAEDGTKKAVLVVTGASSANACRVDVTKQMNKGLYGAPLEAVPGEYMSRLTGQEIGGSSPANTTISVENTGAPTAALPNGLNLAAGDIVEFVDSFLATGASNTRQGRYVVSVTNATDFVINTALTTTLNKGAMCFNRSNTLPLFGTGRGVNRMSGTKAQREAPTTQDYSVVWQASPAGFLITPTADSSSQLVRGRVKIYVRSSVDDKHGIIEPHWVADAEITTFGSSTLVTTYDGGTAAGGGSIVGAASYQIHAVRDDYTGATASSLSSASVVSKLAQVAA
jgi:hypothetical protein